MNKKTKGIIFIIMAAFCFSLMNTFVKLSGDLPPMQKSFFRNLIAFMFSFSMLMKSEQKFNFDKKNLPALLVRGLAGTFGIILNYYSIDHLMLSDSSMLGKLAPFFAIIVSYFVLKEKIKPFQMFSILVAFVGSLFIIKPSGSSLAASLPALAAILGAFFAGLAYTFVRLLGNRGERGAFIVFFFSAFSCLGMLPFLIFDYHTMSLTQLVYLLLAGISATGGQFAITNAYINAPAREISVFDYSQVIFAAITGFILFRQIPDIYSFIGYALIIGIGIITFLINKKENDGSTKKDSLEKIHSQT